MRWNKAKAITISPSASIYGAVLLLILPLDWLLSAIIAAVFHEFCHYLAIEICRGHVVGIRIGAGGIVMEFTQLSDGRECICALAGPLGSFLLFLFIRWVPLIGLCAAIQGFFNLIPIYPLDGGRTLRCVLKMWIPIHAETVFRAIEWLMIAIICAAGCYAFVIFRLSPIPLLIALMVTFRILSRKRPCKE